ncbi:MAG: hypothetical protein WCH99_12375 [Verrucomicrobiota bacterium]
MIRNLDKMFFRILGVIHRWTIRQAQAHCRREKERRFRRLLASSRNWLN